MDRGAARPPATDERPTMTFFHAFGFIDGMDGALGFRTDTALGAELLGAKALHLAH